MNILLGIRIALAGGRESLARMALTAVGVAVGVPLILLAVSAVPIMQAHTDRLAWHRTTELSPPTAPDPALWLAVTDRYEGRDIIRVHVAALGPRPPTPPGVQRLPGPGEKLVSPALAALLPRAPDDELDNRYPGRVVGGIGPAGLLAPDELVAIVGHPPEQLRAVPGVKEISGIEQPGERLDLLALWRVAFALLAVLLIGPVAVFVVMTTRVGGARRELRFAAIRLAGATRLQTAVLAATETAMAAIVGTLAGWSTYLALRPLVASQVTLGHGMPIFAADVRVPMTGLVVVLAGVPVLAVLTTLLALRPVQITPLGVRHRTPRRPPGGRRLAPLAVGLVAIWGSVQASHDVEAEGSPAWVRGVLTVLSILTILIGFFLAGAWVCSWLGRGMARLSRNVTTLIVARRIAADPYATFRVVGGAAIAVYVATSLGFAVAANEQPARADNRSVLGADRPVLDPGVVAVHVLGRPESALGPLLRDGAVVARLAGQNRIVVACADLARVTDLDCPLPTYSENGDFTQDYLRAEDLFTLPNPDPTGADLIFQPHAFAEPHPGDDRLPVQTLLLPTDGTTAAQERIRTLAAVTVPSSRSRTSEDLAAGPALDVSALGTVLPYALVFVLTFAACGLTVAVIAGVHERRRPFALLRASGVRLGELRRIVLLEIGAPLAFTVLSGAGLATLQALVTVAPRDWILPTTGFLVGLGVGVLAAFAVSLAALPFMDTATRQETVRFE